MKHLKTTTPSPRLFRLAALAGLGLGCLPAAQAQSIEISTALGNGADTYLTNDAQSGAGVNKDTNYGSAADMEFRDLSGTRFRALYFRFDISGYSDFSNAQITLSGNTVNRSRGLIFMGVLDGSTEGLGENWDESTIAYSNAAGFAPAGDGLFSTTSELTGELARTSGSAVGDNVTNLSAALDAFLNADTNGIVTFTMYSVDPFNGSEDFYFATKEALTGLEPRLSFDATAVPEPSMAALLVGFGAMVFGLRRRR